MKIVKANWGHHSPHHWHRPLAGCVSSGVALKAFRLDMMSFCVLAHSCLRFIRDYTARVLAVAVPFQFPNRCVYYSTAGLITAVPNFSKKEKVLFPQAQNCTRDCGGA
jgi:hypothetical protein